MNPNDFESLKKHFDTLQPNVPAEGGRLEIIRGPSKGFTAIVGDRTGLIRLAAAILKYAIHSKERALILNNFFTTTSPERNFMIQIEDAPSTDHRPAKPHSVIRTVANVLLKKKQ